MAHSTPLTKGFAGIVVTLVALASGCHRVGPDVPAVVVLPAEHSLHQIGRYCASEKAMVAAPGEKGYLSFGPYADLAPGPYEATFDLAVSGATGTAGRVDVNAFAPGQATGVLTSSELATNGPNQRITLKFEAGKGPRYEFRVASDGTGTIRLRSIVVSRAAL